VDQLTKDQRIMQLEMAVQILEVDRSKLTEIDKMLEIVLHNLIENRRDLLKQEDPTIEEILIQECRARIMEALD
jgi:hypothetical protein